MFKKNLILCIVLLAISFFSCDIFSKQKKASAYKKSSKKSLRRKFFDQGYKQKNIWFHAYDSNEVLSILGIVFTLIEKYQIPESNIIFTARTAEGVRYAKYFLQPQTVRMIPNDDFSTMAYNFNIINPSAIITVKHEVSPTMICLGKLFDVPIYLFNASLSGPIERKLFNETFLYKKMLNSLTKIFVDTPNDQFDFQDIGISSSIITHLGPPHLCGLELRSQASHRIMQTTLEKVREVMHWPIILIHSQDSERIDCFLDLYLKLKKEIPLLKMVFAPGTAITWKKKFLRKIRTRKLKSLTWDYNNTYHFTAEKNDADGFTERLAQEFSKVDVILVAINGALSYLESFSSILLLDEYIHLNDESHLIEASFWKLPVILIPKTLGSVEGNFLHSTSNLVMATGSSKNQLFELSKKYLVNKSARNQQIEKQSSLLNKQVQDCKTKLEPFFTAIKDDLEKSNILLSENVIADDFF